MINISHRLLESNFHRTSKHKEKIERTMHILENFELHWFTSMQQLQNKNFFLKVLFLFQNSQYQNSV